MANALINKYLGTEAEPMTTTEIAGYKSYLEKCFNSRPSVNPLEPADREFYLEGVTPIMPLIIDCCAKKRSFGPAQIVPCDDKSVYLGQGCGELDIPAGSWEMFLPNPLGLIDQIGKMQLGHFPIFSGEYEFSEAEKCFKKREHGGWQMHYYLFPAIFTGCKERIIEEAKKSEYVDLRELMDVRITDGKVSGTESIDRFFEFQHWRMPSNNPRVTSNVLSTPKGRFVEQFADPLLQSEPNIALQNCGDYLFDRATRYILYPKVPDTDISYYAAQIREQLTAGGLDNDVLGLSEITAQAKEVQDLSLQMTAAKLKFLLSGFQRRLRKQYSPLELDLEKYPLYPSREK